MNHCLDKMDIKILNILQNNSKTTIREIASKVGLSATPTNERIKNMIREGYIEKYIAVLDTRKLGLQVMVYCQINLKDQSKSGYLDFEREVQHFTEVVEIIGLFGTSDYLLKIACSNINFYKEFVKKKLCAMPNIAKFSSNIVSKEIKKELGYPLELLGESKTLGLNSKSVNP